MNQDPVIGPDLDTPHRELLEDLFEGAPRPTIIKDDESRFLFLNSKACEMFGMGLDDILGRTGHDFLPADEAQRIREADAGVLNTGEERLFEERVTSPDGSTRTLLTHKRRSFLPTTAGKKPVLIVVISDITELRDAEKVLRASEEHYRSLIELHPQTPWLADALGNVIEVGPGWQNASGREVGEALGRGWEKTLHPKDLPEVVAKWELSVKTGAPFDMIYRIGTAKGRYRWYRNRAAARLDDNGGVVRWYGLLEDVHDRQLALKALQSSERRLRQHRDELEKIVLDRTAEVQEKNIELDRLLQHERGINALQRRFVGMISHEFRTPLAVIDGAAQRLTRTKAAATPQFLEGKALQIKGAVARMVELMESILAAGRLETGTIAINKELGSLSSILRHCIASRAEISKSHTISHDLEALPALQMIDGAAIERVFSNLLSNAVKYSPAGSKIRVSGWKEGQRVLVSVSDSGIGMDADDLPKLFEPYFRARSATGIAGTGIGLNIVKEIVELHGGSISVQSILGKGTTFTVELPFDEIRQLHSA
ncbi:sensor histidine kinase [Neorhizobium galegae]|uniref:histidine kinase n=1 Tax=Neorhizobium galegae bv. officinalis TaxID=323656 RepID=A0A0T7GAH7_NEOGA|nr:PAS domain-containing sensor histidine kinase [Neorhizobium galegae]CDZ44291.1 PAS/PAC sensor signal transduction histidine kinase [Neorhizobium galegae bv. officinalis]